MRHLLLALGMVGTMALAGAAPSALAQTVYNPPGYGYGNPAGYGYAAGGWNASPWGATSGVRVW